METIYGTQTIFGMQTISGTETISEMETTICGVTGKNTFSLTNQGIGIATGTATATTGGMATNAPSLMDPGRSSTWAFLRGGLRTTRTITTTTMAFRMMATARRPTVTIIRIRTIMIPAITPPAITRGRCITIKTAIPTNRRATTIPVFTKLKRTTIRMATAMNRNQTLRPLPQHRSDWLVKATIAARQTVCSALRWRKPSGVIKAPMACARLATSTATPSRQWDYPKPRATKFEIGHVA